MLFCGIILTPHVDQFLNFKHTHTLLCISILRNAPIRPLCWGPLGNDMFNFFILSAGSCCYQRMHSLLPGASCRQKGPQSEECAREDVNTSSIRAPCAKADTEGKETHFPGKPRSRPPHTPSGSGARWRVELGDAAWMDLEVAGQVAQSLQHTDGRGALSL